MFLVPLSFLPIDVFSNVETSKQGKRTLRIQNEVGREIPILAGGIVLLGSGKLMNKGNEHIWNFPFSSKPLKGTQIEIELFWKDWGSVLFLILNTNGKESGRSKKANTRSQFLKTNIDNGNPQIAVRLAECQQVKNTGETEYSLRCIVRRRQREIPKSNFKVDEFISLGESTIVSILNESNERWWNIRDVEKREQYLLEKDFETTLWVSLVSLEGYNLNRCKMQIYEAEKDSDQYKTPYLRKTALIGNGPSNLECFLPLENLSKLGGGNRQLLVRVRLVDDSSIVSKSSYRLKAKLLFQKANEEALEFDGFRPLAQGSVVRLAEKKPWGQKLIAAEKWATHRIQIPEFQRQKFGKLFFFLTEAVPRLESDKSLKMYPSSQRERVNPIKLNEISNGRYQASIPLNGQRTISPEFEVPAGQGKGQITYQLKYFFLPEWKIIPKGKLTETAQHDSGELRPQSSHRWSFLPETSGHYEIIVAPCNENSEEAQIDLDVYAVTNEHSQLQTRTNGFLGINQKRNPLICSFQADSKKEYTILVSVVDSQAEKTPYNIRARTIKNQSEVDEEGIISNFGHREYRIRVAGPATVLVEISHPNSGQPAEVEVIKNQQLVKFDSINYGTHDELVIPIPEDGEQVLIIRSKKELTNSKIYYTIQRKGIENRPIISGKNDQFAAAEQVNLSDQILKKGIELRGQITLFSDPADCWYLNKHPKLMSGYKIKLNHNIEGKSNSTPKQPVKLKLQAYDVLGQIIDLNQTEKIYYIMVSTVEIPNSSSNGPEEYQILISTQEGQSRYIQLESDRDCQQ